MTPPQHDDRGLRIEAEADQAVVRVRLVRRHHALLRAPAPDNGRYDIERRDHHARADHEHGVAGEVVPASDHGASRKEEPEGHASSVTEVDVALSEVVKEETDAAAEDPGDHHIEERVVVAETDHEEARGGYHGYAAGQSVEPVYEIERVHEADEPEDSDRVAEPPEFPDGPEEELHSLHCHAARDHADRHRGLHGQLHTWLQVDAVVYHPEYDDDRPTSQ